MIRDDSLSQLRALLMAILILGMAGSTVELLLLGHYEDVKQIIPLSLFGVALVVLAWHRWAARRATVCAIRLIMAFFVVSGFAGVILHVRSSIEFQTEVDPALQGMDLLLKSLKAKAPPALAPGLMVQLGLLGLAYTYRHPALAATDGTTGKRTMK